MEKTQKQQLHEVLDNSNIKKLKPRKNSRYHQGYIQQTDLKKYYSSCKDEPVIFRSGLELKFIQYCEGNPNITKWASEPISIPYFNRLSKSYRHYYPDYIIENKEGQRTIIEVKPYDQTFKPGPEDSRWLKETWITNTDKWKAAQEFAHENNMKFIIVTEKFFE